MQASQSFKIVIVTLHLFRCCSTIKIRFRYSLRSRVGNLSVALLHFVIHCSVFKVRPLTTLAIRFEDLTEVRSSNPTTNVAARISSSGRDAIIPRAARSV